MTACTQNESGARRPDSAPRSHSHNARGRHCLRPLHPRTPLIDAVARPRPLRWTSSATPGHPSTSQNHFLSNPGTPNVLLKHRGCEPQLTSNHTDKVERGEEIGGLEEREEGVTPRRRPSALPPRFPRKRKLKREIESGG